MGWTDTRAAMNTEIEFPRMSDADVEREAWKIMHMIDLRKPEDMLYLTEVDWKNLHLPMSFTFAKHVLIDFMLSRRIMGTHKATFWAAQKACQPRVERLHNYSFPNVKNSAFAHAARDGSSVVASKGVDLPPSRKPDETGLVRADCLQCGYE